jgi:hypothetical protein
MDENLTLGEVVNGTITTIAENKDVALSFIAVLTILGAGFEWGLAQLGGGALDPFANAETVLAWFGIGAGLGGLVFLIVGIVAQYLLWEIMLKRKNHLAAGEGRRYLAFIGLAILTALGVGVGFLLLIVPGLIFSARWAMAPAFLIVERKGIVESMSNSWDDVQGNTTPVVLAILIVAIVTIGLGTALEASALATVDGTEVVTISLTSSLLSQLLSQTVTVLQAGLGVYLFGRLHGASDALSGVFE